MAAAPEAGQGRRARGMSMCTGLRRFCAALALMGCGAAFARAGDAPPAATVPPLPGPRQLPPLPAPPPPAPGSAEPAKPDAPTEVPGLPPLPPAPQTETCDAGVPLTEEPCGAGGGFFADAEYLYLKPYRRGLDFAIVSPNADAGPEGSIQSDPWHTRSAFRVGGGYRMSYDGPDVGFYYTYLHDDQIAGLFAPAGGRLFATQTHPGTVELVGRATAEATLSYNVFDLEVGRRVGLGEALAVRPFGGLRFAEIGQNFTVLYDGGDANQDRVGSRLKFDGGGVRAGAEVDWMLLDHWSLYGRAAGSLLTGDFHATQTEFNNAGATPLTNVEESFRKITPAAELAFGVAYQAEHVRLSVGYEVVNWFNLVDTPSFVSDVQQGKYLRNVSDLGVEGLAVKAEFAY